MSDTRCTIAIHHDIIYAMYIRKCTYTYIVENRLIKIVLIGR